MKLIAGLGNPGPEYEGTRHNAGFIAFDFLLEKYGLGAVRRKRGYDFVSARVKDTDTAFIKPQLYMNLSGEPVLEVMDEYGIPPERLLVIHDDVDIPLGSCRYKVSGGDGGHNGLRSIVENIGSRDFQRIRMGIGRPEEGISVTDHVLDRFLSEEIEVILNSLEKVAQLVEDRFLTEVVTND